MYLTAKQVARLSDDQVLELAGGMGPAIIGPHLFERAQKVEKINPNGAFGPAIIGVAATQLKESKDDELLEDEDDDLDDDDDDVDEYDEEEDELEAQERREREDLARLNASDDEPAPPAFPNTPEWNEETPAVKKTGPKKKKKKAGK